MEVKNKGAVSKKDHEVRHKVAQRLNKHYLTFETAS